MTIVLVEHETGSPARDELVAGEIAAQLGGRIVHLVGGGGGMDCFDCAQHVLVHGELGPNGLLWSERATGVPAGAPVDRGAVAGLDDAVVVVPINPRLRLHREAVARIDATAQARGRTVERVTVSETGNSLVAHWAGADRDSAEWHVDAYGRPSRTASPADGRSPDCRIVMIADEFLQRQVYPANLAVLGDALEAQCLSAEVVFIDPRSVDEADWPRLLADVDGVWLPGGSDMEQVRGQIAVARTTLASGVPTVGLCLGMQSMSTAVAQALAGLPEANLAEADPSAPVKTFVRLHDLGGRPEFRLGARQTRLVPDSELSRLFGATEATVRYNHRFVLDPSLNERLVKAGLRLSGLQAERDLVDAIELPGHPFFIGMQGHPEFDSRRGAPHPMIRGFVAAVAARKEQRG